MNLARKLAAAFGPPTTPPAALAYEGAVSAARSETWFTAAAVPDTVDGRFDVLALAMSLLVIRAQAERQGAFEASLIDRFAADMDASFREMGVGDLAISKAVGQAVSALGGRISAYRAAFGSGDDVLADALQRNLFRGAALNAAALRSAVEQARALAARITAAGWGNIAEGRW